VKERVLLTNDDGYHAPGLRALAEAAGQFWNTVIVAPDRERSAASHALTLNRPLRVTNIDERTMAVDGTPTDCVMLSIMGLLDNKPDLVISGINSGANLGDDVIYSGTVAGAAEAVLLGVPAIAVSFVDPADPDMASGAAIAVNVARTVLRNGLPKGILLNVNIPPHTNGVVYEVTHLGKRSYRDVIVKKTDPRGKPYYWIAGQPEDWQGDDMCDFAAIDRGSVSVTPLHLDMTATHVRDEIASWTFTGQPR
jgi:5'-nucleotidase